MENASKLRPTGEAGTPAPPTRILTIRGSESSHIKDRPCPINCGKAHPGEAFTSVRPLVKRIQIRGGEWSEKQRNVRNA